MTKCHDTGLNIIVLTSLLLMKYLLSLQYVSSPSSMLTVNNSMN